MGGITTRRGRWGAAVATATLTIAAGLSLIAVPAGAAVFGPVDPNIPDGNLNSLRDVIESQAVNAGGDIVELVAGATYDLDCLTMGPIDHMAGDELTINGNGATIRQVGCVGSDDVLNQDVAEPLTLNDVTLTGATQGGAFSADLLVLNRSSILDNGGFGFSGVGAFGTAGVLVNHSTVSGEDLAVSSDLANVIVQYSTIAGNSQGAIFTLANVRVINSTITGNSEPGAGGGISAGGDLTLVYATITGNSAPAGSNIQIGDGTFTSFGSVVTNPLGGGENCDIAGVTPNSQGYNYADDTSCGFTATGDSQATGNNALLGALADNGGLTQTMLPQAGSPLLEAIPAGSCEADGAAGITTDQRDLPRPGFADCDIGAVEVQPPAPPPEPVVLVPTFTG